MTNDKCHDDADHWEKEGDGRNEEGSPVGVPPDRRRRGEEDQQVVGQRHDEEQAARCKVELPISIAPSKRYSI